MVRSDHSLLIKKCASSFPQPRFTSQSLVFSKSGFPQLLCPGYTTSGGARTEACHIKNTSCFSHGKVTHVFSTQREPFPLPAISPLSHQQQWGEPVPRWVPGQGNKWQHLYFWVSTKFPSREQVPAEHHLCNAGTLRMNSSWGR